MRKLRDAILCFLLAICALAGLSAPSLADCMVQASAPPPPLPDYAQPPIPGPGYIWTPGYWAWNSFDYYWVPGTWILPPAVGLLWTPGYWGFSDGFYMFYPGYWGVHVGFYGGIDYGFGYTGVGYEGGHWDHGAFFYNTAVNNIRDTNITNVYNKTVIINNTTVTRVSYNGGRGGIIARPTPQQLQAAHERRIAATPQQMSNAHAALTNKALLASTNHGKPAIAATAHPGVFQGRGVIPARAAGTTPTRPSGRPSLAVSTPEKPKFGGTLPGAGARPPLPASPRLQPSRQRANLQGAQQRQLPMSQPQQLPLRQQRQQQQRQIQLQRQQNLQNRSQLQRRQLRVQQQRMQQRRAQQYQVPQQRMRQYQMPQQRAPQYQMQRQQMQARRPQPRGPSCGGPGRPPCR